MANVNNKKNTPEVLVAFLDAMLTAPFTGLRTVARKFDISESTPFKWQQESAAAEKADDRSTYLIEWLGITAYWHRHIALARKISVEHGIDARLREMAITGTSELMFNNQTGSPIWETDAKVAAHAIEYDDEAWLWEYGSRKRSDVFVRNPDGSLKQARRGIPPNPALLIKACSALLPSVYGERVHHTVAVGGVVRLGAPAPREQKKSSM